jgi:hypothetical protein
MGGASSETTSHLVAQMTQERKAAPMTTIKPVTPDEAAAVWRSIPSPSARRVAKAMSQAGRRVHFATIARWRSQGWRPSGPHPIQTAREALEVAARLLTGDPSTGTDGFVRQAAAGEQFKSLSDGELLRRSARELLILQIALCKVMCSCGVFLVQQKTAETGILLKALAHASRAAAYAVSGAR